MLEPLPGMVVVGEFTDPMEAHLAVAVLSGNDIEATLLSDVVHGGIGGGVRPGVGGGIVSVVVRQSDADVARRTLDEADDDLPPEFVSDEVSGWSASIEDRRRGKKEARRRRYVRGLVVVFVVLVAVLVITGVQQLLS